MDLSTTYLGFQLPHPFIVGASPLSDSTEQAKKLEDAGAAAIILRSLFEEQIDKEALATLTSTEMHEHSFGEAISYFAKPNDFVIGPDTYLEQLRRVKEAVKVPVFGSLNGYTPGGWLDNARLMEQAGADALELNVYLVATDARQSAAQIEAEAVAMVRSVRGGVRIPLAVKLSPFYTSLSHFASQLEQAGADGLVLFNRFFESDIDIEELELRSQLQLSDSRELLLRLRWLAILAGGLDKAWLAVTGGVHRSEDAIKAVMCGASAVQLVSVLYTEGLKHIARLRNEMSAWMEEKEYESLAQMRGSMDIRSCPDPRALSRANYMHQLRTFSG